MQDAARQMQLQILRIVDRRQQKIRQRIFLFGWGIAHRCSEVALRVVVDEKYALVFSLQRGCKVQSSRRLTDATFLIGDCNNGILFHVTPSLSASYFDNPHSVRTLSRYP